MARQWFHKTLGVEENASREEIDRAYRKLAQQYHPDHNDSPFAKERMQELNEAKNQALSRIGQSSKSRRSDSDSKGGSNRQRTKRSTRSHSGAGSRSRSRDNQSSGQDGNNVNRSISITLVEAYSGAIKQIEVQGRPVSVNIPPGIDNGEVVRIAGAGEKGSNGGNSGDLLVSVIVADDPTFERDGDNLRTELSIDFELATHGGKVDVDTLTGAIGLTIPPKSQTGLRLRLSGKGMPARSGGFGDLIVTLSVLPDSSAHKEDSPRASEHRAHTVDGSSVISLPCALTAIVLATICIAAPIFAIRNHNAAVAANSTATAMAAARSTSTAEHKATSTAQADATTTALRQARATALAQATNVARSRATGTARGKARATALAQATIRARSRATGTAPLRAAASNPWQKTATAAFKPIYYVAAKDPKDSRIRACPRISCATIGRLNFGHQIRSKQIVFGDTVNESNLWIEFEYDGEVAYFQYASTIPAETAWK